MLGALVAASTFLAYIASRTVGLPMLPTEPDAWFEPLGIASFVAEGLFLLCAWRALMRSHSQVFSGAPPTGKIS